MPLAVWHWQCPVWRCKGTRRGGVTVAVLHGAGIKDYGYEGRVGKCGVAKPYAMQDTRVFPDGIGRVKQDAAMAPHRLRQD